jgi:transcriptional regulator with XRE-family HTH domain
LRASLGWSQVKLARFLEKNSATVSRWEAGHFAPDAITNSVLVRLWIDVFGSYEGPYVFEDESAPEATKSSSLLVDIGKALLVGGVTYFIVKGLTEEKDG